MAINNPLIPGDPYSYDLKWLVTKVKEILAQLGTLDEAIEAKIFEGFLEHSIVQFKTVPEMLAAEITDGSIVLTLGYHEAGDQGGMFYLVKDFNPAQCSLDYFLTLDNNKQIAIPVIVTPYVTPEMFGAKDDGTTDDSEAFKIALTSFGDHTVITKHGSVYAISQTVPITNTCKIIGNGATIKGPDGILENGIFHVYDCSGVSFDGLIFDVRGDELPTMMDTNSFDNTAIRCDNVEDLSVTGCTFDGLYSTYIKIRGCKGTINVDDNVFNGRPTSLEYGEIPVHMTEQEDGALVTICRNRFEAPAPASYAANSAGIFMANHEAQTIISDNVFINIGRGSTNYIAPLAPIDLYTRAYNITIDNNTFTDCYLMVRIQNSGRSVIQNNKFSESVAINPYTNPISISNTSRYGEKPEVYEVYVLNNIIDQKSTSVPSIGISSQYDDIAPHEIFICDNVMTGRGRGVVLGLGVKNVEIDGNVFDRTSDVFIVMDPSGADTVKSEGIKISGNKVKCNTFIFTQTAPPSTYVSDPIQVCGNEVETSGGIVVSVPVFVHDNIMTTRLGSGQRLVTFSPLTTSVYCYVANNVLSNMFTTNTATQIVFDHNYRNGTVVNN